jgi:hypothetical protein
MAGVFLVGLPLAAIFGVHWTVALLVLVTCGVLAVRSGDSFFHRVADSNWWQVLWSEEKCADADERFHLNILQICTSPI